MMLLSVWVRLSAVLLLILTMFVPKLLKAWLHVGLETGVPVAFGVLTTENIEQAVERAGTKAGNKGVDAAMTAIEMVNLLKNI